MQNQYNLLETKADQLDLNDPLKGFREYFHIPKQPNGDSEIYLCGNSLGLQPKQARDFILQECDKWANLGVKGHITGNYPWVAYHEYLTEGLAQLVGAKPEEVVAMNSLTANLHLMMVSFFRPNNKRCKIIIEHNAFGSDFYAVASQLQYHQLDPDEHLITIKPKAGKSVIELEDWQNLFEQYQDQIAMILIPGVQYQTGQLFNIKAITELAHQHNIIVGADLAHAVGNVPLALHHWEVDFATWCHYKYVNSGPGAVGGCFVHTRHHRDSALPRFAGWWGHNKETRFQMTPKFDPIPTTEGWQLSNPPIVSLAAIRASLDIFQKAGGVKPLREKSLLLTTFLEECLQVLIGKKMTIITPNAPEARGCQLSIELHKAPKQGYELFKQLIEKGVTVDWREPGIIRMAPVPLYNQFRDAFKSVTILSELLAYE